MLFRSLISEKPSPTPDSPISPLKPAWHNLPKKNRFSQHCQRVGHVDDECRSKAKGILPQPPTPTPQPPRWWPRSGPPPPNLGTWRPQGHVTTHPSSPSPPFTTPEGLSDWSTSEPLDFTPETFVHITELAATTTSNSAFHTLPCGHKAPWIVDSGATHHMTPHRDLFVSHPPGRSTMATILSLPFGMSVQLCLISTKAPILPKWTTSFMCPN